jgi:signal transduction histidine kinase/ActR/RegA family two-component response regulator
MTIFAMTDVTAYYNHLKDMEKQKEIADEANKLKSFFLASMSHEIRTPINTVLGMDEMILLENKDPEINQYAKRIQSAGKTLLGIINDILDFSKIEAGKIEIVPVKYDVLELINDLVSNTQSLANDKGLSFEVDIDSHIPRYLIGDETRIKQCITNLLTNAIKYTEKGKVCLTIGYSKDASPDSVCLSVSVKDTGIGIKHEDMDKLFTAFDRLDVVRNRSIKGTGLGLAITKQYVDKMGSELCVESEYNKGSSFSFLLRQLVGGWEQIGEYKFDGNVYDDNKTDKYSVETFYAPAATVLVVDDTENNLFVFESLLKKTGLNIETAASAKQMLKMVTERKYDIIYLDHMMPEMDGIEALHAMEKVSGNMNMTTPVIALTANAIYGSRDFYLGEGFSDYMSKPVSYATLKASLEKYLPPEKKSHAEPIEVYNSNDEIVVISDELAAYEGRGIDVKSGIENSGSGVILLKVLKDFRESVEETANTIERELKKREMKNYTVHVHALKSSARLIGAMRLSAMALNLENIGNEYLNAVKENNTAKSDELLADIEEFTPDLLTYLRSFKELLNVGEDEESESTAEALPKISHEDLDEMLAAMKEFAQAFDMDNVDAVMETIVTYSIPDDKKSLIEELKKAVRNIDYDLIISLLSGV